MTVCGRTGQRPRVQNINTGQSTHARVVTALFRQEHVYSTSKTIVKLGYRP